MQLARLRSVFFPAFLASALVLGAAFYLELAFGQVACSLCQGQRALLGGFSLVCLVALIHRPGPDIARRYLKASLTLALAGFLLATWHVWLQGQFSEIPCEHTGAGLPADKQCMPITWSFFGMSAPEWSLLAFLGCGLMVASRLVPRRWLNPGNPARS